VPLSNSWCRTPGGANTHLVEACVVALHVAEAGQAQRRGEVVAAPACAARRARLAFDPRLRLAPSPPPTARELRGRAEDDEARAGNADLVINIARAIAILLFPDKWPTEAQYRSKPAAQVLPVGAESGLLTSQPATHGCASCTMFCCASALMFMCSCA
jgi:hypothetical protein